MLVLEILIIFAQNEPKVKALNIFKHEFLYGAFADNIAFLSKIENL